MQASTRLIQSFPVDELTGALAVPIYQTCTFVQESPGVNKGFDYSRTANPTRSALEQLLAGLEHGHSAYAFASGMAAIDAVLKLLSTGDQVVAIDDIYGGAFRLFEHVYRRFGIDIVYCNTANLAEVEAAITDRTKLVWLETPSNPTLKISDIAGLAELAHAAGAWLCVDNTFASPVLQQPILLGADLVVHSATKYLGGHSDLIAGAVVAATEELGAQIQFIQNASGAILGPFDSFLVIRGLETLHLRIAQHCSAALKVARFLQTRPEISAVYYPGLESHPNHALAKQQQPDGFGGIIAFVLNEDTVEAATQLATSLQYFKLAVSLGGGKSLVCHSASMTHTAIPAETRRAAGFADSLLRLSIGLEAAEDLIADLARALDSLRVAKEESVVLESEAVLA